MIAQEATILVAGQMITGTAHVQIDFEDLEHSMGPREAYFAETEQVAQPVGRIAAEKISPYPPGVPAILSASGSTRRLSTTCAPQGPRDDAYRRSRPGPRHLPGRTAVAERRESAFSSHHARNGCGMFEHRRAPLDDTLGMPFGGYAWLSSLLRRAGTASVVRTRVLGRPAVAFRGPEAVRFFYDEAHIRRHGAIPELVQGTLFGHGAVHTLDGGAHRNLMPVRRRRHNRSGS